MTSLATADLAHTLIALAAILLCAHGMGSLFVRFRQPRAIGEILGGLLLGATVLGWIWPSAQAWMFPTDGSTSIILGAVYQLGLLLLLFMAGSELRTVFHRGERRTVAAVFAAGMCIPFVAGLGISQVIDQQSLWGPNGNSTSFVFGVLDRIGDHQYPGDLADHARPRHPRHRVRTGRPWRGGTRGSGAVRGARDRHRLRRWNRRHAVRPAVGAQHHRRLERRT